MKTSLRISTVLLAFVCFLSSVLAQAQSEKVGYEITVELSNFDQSEAFLAYYFMDKQFIVDTSEFVDGRVVFSGEEALAEGTYLLVLPPDNMYTQVQIDSDQNFTLTTSADDLVGEMKVKGSKENELFYDYLQFLGQQRPLADSLRLAKQDSSATKAQRTAAEKAGKAIDEAVKNKQRIIKEQHPNTITAAILRSLDEVTFPEFTGTPEEVQQAKYLYYKDHYFDNVDLADPRALRSTYLDQRVSYYMEKLVVPVPDSITKEIDYILEQMKPAPETFRQYVSKFLNEYATSKVVGMDAVYAHIGEKYYMSGIATWTDSTTIANISENVDRIKPLLIGKKAPDLTLTGRDGKPVNLHALESDFTVLFFFDPECSFCKKQTPFVVEFAEKFKDKGVSVVSVCSKFAPEQDSCWSYVDSKKGMNEAMYNTIDPFHRSKYKVKYDVKSFPQIYVLNEEKTIVSKRIAGDQLEEVVSRLIAMKEEQEIERAAPGSGK